MNHLTPEQLSALLDDALPAPERAHAQAHLAACEACRAEFEALRAGDALIGETRVHDPGDAYFATFAARVAERIAAEPSREAASGAAREVTREAGPAALADTLPPARPARETSPWYDIGSWFRAPARLAWVGGVAAVIVAAGVVLMIARESGVPELRDAKILERSARSDAKTAAPGAATTPPAGGARVDDAIQERAEPPADADRAGANEAESRLAAPARVRQMKPGPGGEPVPVGPPPNLPGFAREAAPPPPPAPAGEPVRVRRDRRAEPLAGSPQGTAAKDEAPAPAASLEASKPAADALAQTKRAATTLGESAGVAGKLSFAKEGGSCGSVTDAKGRPIARAQVVIGDRGITATTGDDGRFCFDVPAGDYDLSVFAVGFTPLRRVVSFGDPQAPVRLALQTVEVLPAPVPGARPPSAVLPDTRVRAAGPPPVPPALPDNLRPLWQEAARLTDLAAREHSAVRFDAAAEAWNVVIASLRPGDIRTQAFEHRANARYSAWEIEPTGPRQQAAVEALHQLLGALPAGPLWDRTRERLDRVET